MPSTVTQMVQTTDRKLYSQEKGLSYDNSREYTRFEAFYRGNALVKPVFRALTSEVPILHHLSFQELHRIISFLRMGCLT